MKIIIEDVHVRNVRLKNEEKNAFSNYDKKAYLISLMIAEIVKQCCEEEQFGFDNREFPDIKLGFFQGVYRVVSRKKNEIPQLILLRETLNFCTNVMDFENEIVAIFTMDFFPFTHSLDGLIKIEFGNCFLNYTSRFSNERQPQGFKEFIPKIIKKYGDQIGIKKCEIIYDDVTIGSLEK